MNGICPGCRGLTQHGGPQSHSPGLDPSSLGPPVPAVPGGSEDLQPLAGTEATPLPLCLTREGEGSEDGKGEAGQQWEGRWELQCGLLARGRWMGVGAVRGATREERTQPVHTASSPPKGPCLPGFPVSLTWGDKRIRDLPLSLVFSSRLFSWISNWINLPSLRKWKARPSSTSLSLTFAIVQKHTWLWDLRVDL